MDNYKITDTELNSGVVKAPDILNDTAQNNKLVFDRLPRLIAEKYNTFVEHIKNSFYTKAEVNKAIDNKVIEVGAGDMTKSVYDTDGDGVVDNADKVNGFWFSFKDAEGNPTDEPYIHWMED